MKAVVLMANPCTKSLGVGRRVHKHPMMMIHAYISKRLSLKLKGEMVNVDEMTRERCLKCREVDYYIGERLKLEGETENMGVCTKEWERRDSRGTHGHSLHQVTGM